MCEKVNSPLHLYYCWWGHCHCLFDGLWYSFSGSTDSDSLLSSHLLCSENQSVWNHYRTAIPIPLRYATADGEHFNKAVRYLLSVNLTWAAYTFFSTILRGGHSADLYNQLATFHDHKNNSTFYIEMKLYDASISLCRYYDRICIQKKKRTNIGVAKEYFGTEPTIIWMKMISSIAVMLNQKVIDLISDVTSIEHPNLFNPLVSTQYVSCTSEQVTYHRYCRVYISFVKLQYIYNSKLLMRISSP